MYRTDEEIEYGNGILATVVCVPREGMDCADGAFIIWQAGAGFALCYRDLETDEEVWSFADGEDTFHPRLGDVLARYYEGPAA